jgi:hypothetical protein
MKTRLSVKNGFASGCHPATHVRNAHGMWLAPESIEFPHES